MTLEIAITINRTATDLIIKIAGAVIGGIILLCIRVWYKRNKAKIFNLRQAVRLGRKFLAQGVTKFHFSRDDYGRTLATFLESAKNSITIVSMSLKNTHDEGRFTDIFRKKLTENPNFEIKISLLNPNNLPLIKVAADTLHQPSDELRLEIIGMYRELLNCAQALPSSEKARFKILSHDCFPMGSVVMLDCTPQGGIIQVETKLYRATRVQSFGFQITKKSPFYMSNFTSWNHIVQDSKLIEDSNVL